ncbi:hypothetical protein [Halarchaeum sp. P4]|uniref:hypothetical protein n=1 Tax=Halarchaeum sp. P4 TaxID=3421639 RepID=UPI003EBE68D7
MPATTRRDYLRAAAGVGVAGALAGCSSDDSTTPRLGDLTALNFHDEPHTVRVLMLDGEDVVYWEQTHLSAGSSDAPSGAAFAGYPTESGEYVLSARVDERAHERWARVDFAEHDAACLGLKLFVGDNRTDGNDLSVMYTTDSGVCRDERTRTTASATIANGTPE